MSGFPVLLAGHHLTRAARACFGVERMRQCERRWYTLWLWRHDESNESLRARVLEWARGAL